MGDNLKWSILVFVKLRLWDKRTGCHGLAFIIIEACNIIEVVLCMYVPQVVNGMLLKRQMRIFRTSCKPMAIIDHLLSVPVLHFVDHSCPNYLNGLVWYL